jgi:hypothetical protein
MAALRTKIVAQTIERRQKNQTKKLAVGFYVVLLGSFYRKK